MSTVIRVGKVGLAVGLDWRLLPSGRKRAETDRLIRELSKDNDAHQVNLAVRSSDGQQAAGLFARPDAEDIAGGSMPARVYSAAAILARMAGEAQNVIAALVFQDDAGRERVAVLVVEGGLPAAESVSPLEKAIDTVRTIWAGDQGFAGHRLFTNQPDSFTSLPSEMELLTFEQLLENASADSKLRRPPANLRLIAGVGVTAVVVGAAIFGAKTAYDSYAAQKRAEEARRRDPVPKYQKALAAQIGRLGLARPSISALLSQLTAYPVWVRGWELKEVGCTAAGCRSSWERRGGTTRDLLALRPGEELVTAESTADKAVLQWLPAGLEQAGWSSLADAPAQAQAFSANLPLYQVWADAGIRLQQSGAYAVWPNTGLEVPPEVALKAQPIEVRLPWVLTQEAVQRASTDVFWESLNVSVDIASKATPLQVTLKGTSYVR